MRRLTALALGMAAVALTAAAQVTITTTSVPNAVASQSYSFQLQTSGGSGQFVWSLQSGKLPNGIGLDIATGLLVGTAPGLNASYPFTVRVLDLVTSLAATQALTINVVGGLEITTTALPNATVNQQYSFQLEGTGPPPLVWTVQVGSLLPSGFSLSTDGMLTGLGGDVGIFMFGIQLSDSDGTLVTTRNFDFLVTLGRLGIQDTAQPPAIQNVPYMDTLLAQGGLPPYTWSFDTTNTQGLSIGAGTGIISGTPPNAGVFSIPVSVHDFTGEVFSKLYTINVGPAVAITKASLANGSPGVAYLDTLTATGGSFPYRWAVKTGTLPTGLTLDSVKGQIGGTPTAPGTFPFTIQVTDFVGGIDSKAFTITIGQGLVITPVSLPGGVLGQLYSQTLAVTGAVPPLTWTIASGALPPPLTLDRATGVISGTPTSAGDFTFDVLVTDASKSIGRRTFTLKIPLLITSGDLTGSVLTPFSQTLAAVGGATPYTWSATSGTLPVGLQLNGATGVIGGTPGAGSSNPVTFTVTDVNGLTGTKTITITILQPMAPDTTIGVGSTTQPAVSLTTGAPYGSEITGLLTLAFAPAPGVVGTDAMIRFAPDGSSQLEYTVPANQTQAIFPTISNGTPAIMTGTVAGTITLTVSMFAGGQDITPSPAPTKTITIAPAVPVINSVTLQQVSGGLSVVVTGYSNTREVSSGTFSFTVSSGNTAPAAIVVPLTSAYATWFNNTTSNATGGQFKLTVPFSVTGGATAVTKVTVTLTNSKGASAAVSSP
jgi:Putative Ig domain